MQSIRSSNFIFLLSAFTIIEYSFFCYFYYLLFPKEALVKKIILIIWISFLIFSFIDFFYINKMQTFDSFASGIESIIILILCIHYLFSQIKGVNNLLIYSTFNFWIIVTFLIYFSGTFFLYIMTYSLRSDITFQKQYLIINSIFSILKNILLCVAMTMKTNYTIKQPPSLPELDGDVYFHKNN